MKNFRPVCQNPTSGKVVDKCGNTSLKGKMEALKLISEYFFGFRSGMSTTDALISLLDDIQEARRKKLKKELLKRVMTVSERLSRQYAMSLESCSIRLLADSMCQLAR